MKKKFKLIVPSFLTLIFCLLLIAGSTFAIFSSQDQASIEVTSGKVKMTADLTGLLAYSVEATDGTGNAGSAEAFGVTSNYNYVPATPVVENQSYKFANGGLVNFNEEKTLILSNVTPGDRITLKLTLTNDSNVDIKYRVRLNATEDNGLLEGLTFKMQEGTNEAEEFVGVIKVGNWTPWSAPANNDAKVKEINLELVLPVDAGNEYQEKTAKLRFTVEAVQANAKVDTLLEEVNAYLANASQSAKVNKTMHDAKAEAEAYRPAFDATKYLWNIDTDQFYAEDNVVTGQGFEGRFFKAYTEALMPAVANQTFSIYATGAWTNHVNVVVGFDAGDATGISNVSYVRTGENVKAQEVVIRTNSASTAIEINAPKDIVHHYGVAGSLDIIAVAGQSYHEFGTVGFIQIAKGRVALEKDSSVNQLHFDYNETAQKFDEIVVAVDSTVTLPKLSRDVVENIGANGTLVVELQDNTNAEQANSDYIWLYQQGLVEQIRISDSNESAGNVKATAYEENTNTYKAADDIANNLREGLSYDDLKKEDGSVLTEDSVGATVVNGGKTEQQKGQEKQAAITEVTQKVCLHVNKNYVSDGSTWHHAVCQDCGKVFASEKHRYEMENAGPCLDCGYSNIIKYTVTVNGDLDEDNSTKSLYQAIEAFNNSTDGTKDYVIELDDGVYTVDPNFYIIQQAKINKDNTLTIKAKNMPTDKKGEYNVTIKPNYSKLLSVNGTVNNVSIPVASQFLFGIDGNSNYTGDSSFLIQGIYFDFTTQENVAGGARLNIVYCFGGNDGRYGHNVTVDTCHLKANGGKLASFISANSSNSSPHHLKVTNCYGENINAFLNVYGANHTIKDCEGKNMLIVGNFQSSSGTMTIDNVDGSFFYAVSGDTTTERWLVKVESNTTVNISNCTWTLLANAASGDNTGGKDPHGALASVGTGSVYNISDVSLTRYSDELDYPFAKVKPDKNLTINGKVNNEIIQVIVNNGNNGWGSDITTFQTINQ